MGEKILPSVEAGTTIKCVPLAWDVSFKWARKAMTCTVLPRPISSARMPETPCLFRTASQLRPTIWYGASLRLEKKMIK